MIKRCLKYPWLQDNDLYENQYDDVKNNTNYKTTTFMKTNMTMSWTTPTPRQWSLIIIIKRCFKHHWLQDNDLYENQYDDVMNNPNSKTTTLNYDKTMSKIPLTPRQRPLWKPIWRCQEQHKLQDNDLYENQYDDVMNNSNSKTMIFNNNN